MSNPTNGQKDSAELKRLRFRMMGAIALSSAAAATVVFVVMLYLFGEPGGTNYAEIIQSYSVRHSQLIPMIFLSGLVLLVIVCVVSWLVALYGSFRVAGPLYRFQSNMEESLRGSIPQGIRSADALQQLSQSLQVGITTLDTHYAKLDELAEQAIQVAQRGDEEAKSQLSTLLHAIRTESSRVKLDD